MVYYLRTRWVLEQSIGSRGDVGALGDVGVGATISDPSLVLEVGMVIGVRADSVGIVVGVRAVCVVRNLVRLELSVSALERADVIGPVGVVGVGQGGVVAVGVGSLSSARAVGL